MKHASIEDDASEKLKGLMKELLCIEEFKSSLQETTSELQNALGTQTRKMLQKQNEEVIQQIENLKTTVQESVDHSSAWENEAKKNLQDTNSLLQKADVKINALAEKTDNSLQFIAVKAEETFTGVGNVISRLDEHNTALQQIIGQANELKKNMSNLKDDSEKTQAILAKHSNHVRLAILLGACASLFSLAVLIIQNFVQR